MPVYFYSILPPDNYRENYARKNQKSPVVRINPYDQ
jgi:hypothetical protein